MSTISDIINEDFRELERDVVNNANHHYHMQRYRD